MILSSRIDGCNAKCDHCRKLFHRKPSRLRTMQDHACSLPCRNELDKSKNITPCENCGKPFYRVPGKRKQSKHHCCSKKCSNELHTGALHVRFDGTLRGRKCAYCSKEITNPQAKKYCSFECRSKANSGSNHSRYSQRAVSCGQCGKNFTVPKSQLKEKNFCGRRCQSKYHSLQMKAENNPRFKHGHWLDLNKPKLLYKGFTRKIRQQVRQRDNNTCQVCFMNENEHKIKLHVHHIDYDKTHNELCNLITVCRYCHGKIHGDEPKWKRILSKMMKVKTLQLNIFV
jgi:hypothetical protein